MSDDNLAQIHVFENQEWLNSLAYLLENKSPERVREVLSKLQQKAEAEGVSIGAHVTTPYINTIDVNEEEEYPGDLEIEKKLSYLVRWNSMAMASVPIKSSAALADTFLPMLPHLIFLR